MNGEHLQPGHNRPPLSEELLAQLREETDPLFERKAAVVASLDKVEIRDQEDIGRVGDTARIIKEILDKVEDKRSAVLAPVYLARDAVNSAADDWTRPLVEGRKALGEKVDTFRAEQTRLAKVEAEAQRAEEQRRAAAAGAPVEPPRPEPAPEPTRAWRAPAKARGPIARGDYGGKVGVREVKELAIEDIAKVPSFVLDSDLVKEAILKVARAFIDKGVTVPGISVTTATKTNFS
jgi:hypothetical protein